MKALNKSLLGAAIAALLSTSAAAMDTVRPPLLPGKLQAHELQPPSDRLIVKFRDAAPMMASASARADALSRLAAMGGVTAKAERDIAVGGQVVRLSRKLDHVEMDKLLDAFRSDPSVELAMVDRLHKPVFTPNDPLYGAQWHYFHPTAGMNLPAAWDISRGVGTVVAVLDTGITAHSDLNSNIQPGYDFNTELPMANDGNGRDNNPADPGDWVAANECGSNSASNSSWHGTHVTGTIAAVTNNNIGVAGVASRAKVVPVRVLGKCGGYTSDIADGIIWASGGTVSGVPANPNPAEVINMSLGGFGSCDPISQAAINGAVQRGTVVVVAAGNSNSSADYYSPASCNKVITVASHDATGIRSGFSNAGKKIDVSATGGEGVNINTGIGSTANTGTTVPLAETYVYMQGTSMAAPHVAGVVAMMQAANPNTPADVENILKLTAKPMPGELCPGGCGTGRVDALAALNGANGTFPKSPTVLLRNGVGSPVPAGGAGSEARYVLPTYAGVKKLSFAIANGTGNVNLYVRFGAQPTTTTYDCRSINAGNAESCPIVTPQIGSYYVLVRGVAAHSGARVSGKFATRTFANKNDVTILDNGPTASSPILVHGRGTAKASATTKVTVAIHHTFAGDLTLNLRAPDGTLYPLSHASGSADSIETTWTVDASAETANGTWQLVAQDKFDEDVGHIDSWVLKL